MKRHRLALAPPALGSNHRSETLCYVNVFCSASWTFVVAKYNL